MSQHGFDVHFTNYVLRIYIICMYIYEYTNLIAFLKDLFAVLGKIEKREGEVQRYFVCWFTPRMAATSRARPV